MKRFIASLAIVACMLVCGALAPRFAIIVVILGGCVLAVVIHGER